MTNLLDILQRREAIAQDDESRVSFKFRQAECRFRSLDDCLGAIEDYRAVFELDPAHEASIASLEEIIGVGGEPAIEAAKVLQPVYQGLERWPELVKVDEVLAAGSEDMEELIGLLGTIGMIQEEMLESPKAAFDAWFRALSHDPTRDESWEKVENLADSCDCNAELAEKLDALIPELSSDATSAIIVAKHLSKTYEEKLAQPEKSIEALQRVLEMDSNDVEAIHGLDRLYEGLEKWNELAELLHTEIDIAETDEERLNSYYRLGAVQEMYLQNYEEAVNSYNEMRPGLGAPIFFNARTIGGVNFVAIDDSYHQFEPWQLTRLKKEIAKGLPIVLCLHAPLFEQSLFDYHIARTGPGCSSYLVGCDEDHLPDDEWRAIEIRPRGITEEAVAFIKAQPLIKAVLAGHVHFSFVSELAPGMTQFVTGGGYAGVAREITLS